MSLEIDQKLYHMARLEISKVITGDKGEYRAVAKNKHGEGVATINLNFEGSGKPKFVSHYYSIHKYITRFNKLIFIRTNTKSFQNQIFSIKNAKIKIFLKNIKIKHTHTYVQNTRRKITEISEKTDNSTRRRHTHYGMHTGSESGAGHHLVSGRKNNCRFGSHQNVAQSNRQRYVRANVGN